MTERMGRYRLDGVIGVGSFATVHRAVDERLDDVVVVKVLAENHSLNPEVRERFIAEGRSIRRVTSPHVVTVHDIGESDRQQPYLVLEHADRGTLAGRVAALRARGWTPSRADVLVTARSLAAALEAVHRAGLVHRDLSPGNVLLTSVPATPADTVLDAGPRADVVAPGERLVVADLGMCKDLALNSGLTVAGGTSGFRPPEQDGPGVVDTRADLWAMSTLLRWMCGEPSRTGLPGELFTALDRSTAQQPADRHPDVAAWLADVEGALASPEPVPAGVAEPDPTVDHSPSTSPPADAAAADRSAARPRRRRTVVGALATLLLGVIVGVVVGLQLAAGPPASAGAAAVAVDGPAEVTVATPATFTAVTSGVESWVWTLPTGEHVLDEPTVTVTARSPGDAVVVLRARAPDGTELETAHHLTVQE
ncbi:serine/threonine-protein kinase [Georgenia sunbinii]|uniref:serine/threonine-protein kinase n=1 Tax=Georgenia sunbinii TaxID=3117728 RepID=UPI002F26C968